MENNNNNNKLFALFIGRSGSGKSVAAASLPKPLEELDFDLRANGIKDAVSQGWLNGENIFFKEFDPFGGFIPIQQHLTAHYNLIAARAFKYQTLDVGSLTSLIRLLDLTVLNTPKDISGIGHLNISGLAITGAADYKFESQAAHKIFDYLRVFPCNVIVSAHIIDKYGRNPNAKDQYSPQVVVGEKL